MYKDKDKQREANAERQRRYKEKHKGVTSEGVTDKALPERYVSESGSESGFDDETSPEPERTAQGNIRVSKPGDSDYEPQCETTRAFIEGRDKRPESGKRGFDIKCFEDLPVDVQETINQMCRIDDNKIDATAKANRTAIAVNYQHQFPDRFHNTGMSRTDSTKGAGL